MSVIGNGVAQSVAGAIPAGAAASREIERRKEEKKAVAKRTEDLAELTVETTQTTEAVRPVAGNEQEEAHEDHRATGGYNPSGSVPAADPASRRIDLQG